MDVKKALMDKIEACEMWLLRRMGKISWKQKMKNEDVLKNLRTEKTFVDTINARELNFLFFFFCFYFATPNAATQL